MTRAPSPGPKARRGARVGAAYDPAVDIPHRLIELQTAADAEQTKLSGLVGDENSSSAHDDRMPPSTERTTPVK